MTVQDQFVTRTLCSVFLAATFVSVNPASGDDGYGSVAGQIVFEGMTPPRRVLVDREAVLKTARPEEDVLDESLLIDQESRGVANVFVWPDRVSSIHPRFKARQTEAALLTFDGFRVGPHCLVMQTDQELRLRSIDGAVSNAFLRTWFNSGWNVLVPASGEDVSLRPFERNERYPVEVTSNLQPWLRGWIKVSDHPYGALSDTRGHFQINWLPAGKYQFMIWHERASFVAKRLPVTVRDRKITRLGVFKLTPKDVGIQ